MKITFLPVAAAAVILLNGYSYAADVSTASNTPQVMQSPAAPIKQQSIGVIPPAKHFEIRSNNEFSQVKECRVVGTNITCHGKLEKLPPETVSFQSISSGKISGNMMKTTSTSVTKLEDTKDKCSANIYSSWTESIALSSDHIATIKTGKVSSRINKFGPEGCQQVDYSSSPPITIAGTWRELE
ncbi:MAG TPA: hypothetical protein VL360_02760 [Gammaproteobacteria bacterium]|jgi:hypothetical protein|nr:hypothetical protein [Gammaproteobacteria bacterium]